jgi:hypothetical protein
VLFTKCRFSGAKFFFVSLDREIASLKMWGDLDALSLETVTEGRSSTIESDPSKTLEAEFPSN